MAEKNSLWKNIRKKAEQNRRTGTKPKKPSAEMLRQERKIKAQKADGGPVGDDGLYNMQRALELGYTPDETGHWPSVDSETGMWLKSKDHDTAWMEHLYGYALNPEVQKQYQHPVVNAEGYFGENQLQYNLKADGGYMYDGGGKTYANKQGVIMGPVQNPDGTYTLPVSSEGLPHIILPEFEVALEANPYGPITGEEYLESNFNPINWVLPSVEPEKPRFRPDGTLIPASGKIDPHYIEEEFIGVKKGKQAIDKFKDIDYKDFIKTKKINDTPKQLPSFSNTVPQQMGFFNTKGALQKYPKGKLTEEEIDAFKNSDFYKQTVKEHSELKNKYGDSWTLPNYADEALQEAIATGNRSRINPILYGGRNWGVNDYIIAGLAGTAYPGYLGITGLAFSPPAVKNKVLNSAGITSKPGVLSSKDTTINITNRPMDFAKVNETADGQMILGGEFIESTNNTVRKAKDWLKATDTYSDKEYSSKDIQSFYGVENGKFKVGKASDFKPNTEIVPRRFGATNISQAVLNEGAMRLLDNQGNPIYQNTPNTGKFILYSPSTKETEFNYINTGKSGVDKVNKFLNKNKDAQYIHLDNGRYEFYGLNPEGLSDQDFRDYYQQDLERKGNPGYNMILKAKGGYMYDNGGPTKFYKKTQYDPKTGETLEYVGSQGNEYYRTPNTPEGVDFERYLDPIEIKYKRTLADRAKEFLRNFKPASGRAEPTFGPIEAALFAPVAGAMASKVASKAIPAVASALELPAVVGGRTIPFLTGNNILGLTGGLSGANVLGSDINSGYYSSNAPWDEKLARGLETGLFLSGSPGVIGGLGMGLNTAKTGYRNYFKNNFSVNPNIPINPLQKPSLADKRNFALWQANEDAATFSQSPYNRKKLSLFRTNNEFNLSNQKARFANDPELVEPFNKLRDFENAKEPDPFKQVADNPKLFLEDQSGNMSQGKYGSRDIGDKDDIIVIDPHLSPEDIYLTSTHEIGHSRTLRDLSTLPTVHERKILDDAWSTGLKNHDGTSVYKNHDRAYHEAEAVQNELRMVLNDKDGSRVYYPKDDEDIKNALQYLINQKHPYVQSVNDFDIAKIRKSLNKIGFAGTTGVVIGTTVKQNLQPEQQSQGGYMNPYMYYAGGPMYYDVGGKVWKNIAAGLYGAGEGILDTVTMGATDQLTDKGFDWLTKVGNKNIDLDDPDDVKFLKTQQQIKGYSNAAGAIGTAIFTGNVQGAIGQGTKGLNTAFQASDWASDDFKKWSQGISGVAGMASGLAGGLNSDSFNAATKAGTGIAGFGQDVNKFGSIGNQVAGMFGSNEQSLWQQAQAREALLKSPEYLAMQAKGTQDYVNQGLSFAANGGPLNNEKYLVNSQIDSMRNRYKTYKTKYSRGGKVQDNAEEKLEYFGMTKVPNYSGFHYENPNGGSYGGENASFEKNEIVLHAKGGPTPGPGKFVFPSEVNGTFSRPAFLEVDKNGIPKPLNKTIAEFVEDEATKGSPFRKHNNLGEERVDAANQKAMEMVAYYDQLDQQQAQQKQMMVEGALQYAAAGGKLNEDISKIVKEEYAAAYGGYINPKKYSGLNMPGSYAKGGGIHIKESKKGTFTAAAKKRGKSVQEFARQVLANKGNYSAAMVKKANFARNAAGWKHAHGGPVVSNVNQGFGLYAQNRGGMMMAQGGNMYANGGPETPPYGFVDIGDSYYNPTTDEIIQKDSFHGYKPKYNVNPRTTEEMINSGFIPSDIISNRNTSTITNVEDNIGPVIDANTIPRETGIPLTGLTSPQTYPDFLPPQGPYDPYGEYGFYGKNTDGQDVSISPNMVTAYEQQGWRPEGRPNSPENPPTKDGQPNDGLGILDYVSGIGNISGPLSQLYYGLKGGDDVNYERIKADKIDPYKAIQIIKDYFTTGDNTTSYNLKQNAPTSGSYMSNMRSKLQNLKDKAAQIANKQYEADVFNTQTQNQVNAQNAQIAMQEQIDRQQEKDAARTNVTEGLSGVGSSAANVIRDYRINQINKSIAENIGTGNTQLVRGADGKLRIVMKPNSGSDWSPTPYNDPYKQSAPAANTPAANVPSTNVTPAAAPAANTTPKSVQFTDNITDKKTGDAFRAWVNKTHPDYAKEKNLWESGEYNNSYIKKAWDEYGKEYLGQ